MTDVYIDVGHDRDDPGAVGYDGRTEHAEGLELAHLLAPRLRAAGITYAMDLTGADPGFRGSTERANASGAAVVIELHRDWRGSAAGEGIFGLYATSAGEAVARAIVGEAPGRGLPVYRDGTIDEDEIGRHGLVFLNETRAPAVILELGRIGDYPEARNRVEADVITAGLCVYLGKPTPDRPYAERVHRDAAIGAVRRPDTLLAAMLADAHDLAFVVPLPDGRWLQTYPDGREVIVDSVGWLVGIGYRGRDLVRRAGRGVIVTEANAHRTALEVGRLVRRRQVDRSEPFA